MPLLTLVLATAMAQTAFDPGPNPLLMRHPSASKTTIVFAFAGDLWTVPRAGGAASRLTSSPGNESDPFFSPDGTQVAFTAQYDGNTDAYVMPAEGGYPVRLTAHPEVDRVSGWTPDGKSVLVQSSMLSNTDYGRMFTVPVTGGIPKALPFPAANEGSISPEGTHFAYVANGKWQQAWKRYRGGQCGTIWVARLSDSKWVAVPKKDTDDRSPIWMGDSIYYMSDPTGPVGLNKYDSKSGRTSVVIKGEGFDIKSITPGADVVAYEKLGGIYLYDVKDGTSTRVNVTIKADFPEIRPAIKDLGKGVSGLGISPSGSRIAVAKRGWVFTIPASKGDTRLIDGEQGLNRRSPDWSPDGKSIAYITDAGGSQKLAIYDIAAATERLIPLADAPGYYDNLRWSPDSKRIAYSNEKLGIYAVEVSTGTSIKIDRQTYRGRGEARPDWSPDSKWLAYSRDLDNSFNAVFLYSFDSGKATQITDGVTEALSPTFDKDGKHLYFLISTNTGSSSNFEDMSGNVVPNTTFNVYAAVLRKDLPNPLQPESDEEKPAKEGDAKKEEPKKDEPKKDEPKFSIDLDGIQRRVIALPIPRDVYRTLATGPAGSVFTLKLDPRATAIDDYAPGTLLKFSLGDRKVTPFATGVNNYRTTPDGSKILLDTEGGLKISPTAGAASSAEGVVNTSGMRVKIDPRAEWRAMYHEVWRNERLLLYDANMHGVDTMLMEKRYEPFLANIVTREDLNYLWTDMLGELSVGHMFIGGGDIPRTKTLEGGLLGADYTFDNGRYRLARIYDAESYNPELVAPLAQPGINAKVGEFLLAINGQELTDAKDIYLMLEGKAGKQTRIKLGPNADGTGSREVIVVPVADESELRFRAWSEDNRRTVEKLTGGKIGYMHIPDTSTGGWREFQRYYYAQSPKSGIIVDDRFNHGGSINDFMVYEMEKPLDFLDISRYGNIIRDPVNGIYGPKVMLVNEMAGSGGDIFPYLFKKHKVGKLVGKRTWGAMISAYGFSVIDGGSVKAPDDAMVDVATGDWCIENYGTPPDISVELDPFLWRQGRDAQLEAAIEQIKKDLANYKPVPLVRPKYPNRSKIGG